MIQFIDLLNGEITFHSEIENPWYWRWICKLFGKKECHEVVVGELEYLKGYLARGPSRQCPDCQEEFVPVDAFDWWCKKCLIARYNSTRPKPEPIIKGREPELTDSAPGGS
jgi:hypothetical protein